MDYLATASCQPHGSPHDDQDGMGLKCTALFSTNKPGHSSFSFLFCLCKISILPAAKFFGRSVERICNYCAFM